MTSMDHLGVEELETIRTLATDLHCPRCTASFAVSGIASAFWQADETVYFSWCYACGWRGDIVYMTTVSAWEREDSEAAGFDDD